MKFHPSAFILHPLYKVMHQPQLESLPRKELEALQLERLRATVKRIGDNNPEYARRWNGLGPDDVRALADIRRFPFLTKEDLRHAYPFGMACAPQRDFVRMHMSSGTTGTPIICPHTAADVAQWSEIMARCLTSAGVTHDDVIQITPSFGLFNGGFGFHFGATAIGDKILVKILRVDPTERKIGLSKKRAEWSAEQDAESGAAPTSRGLAGTTVHR